MEQSVPKRGHRKFRRQEITQHLQQGESLKSVTLLAAHLPIRFRYEPTEIKKYLFLITLYLHNTNKLSIRSGGTVSILSVNTKERYHPYFNNIYVSKVTVQFYTH
jgi:hypothetical protein